MWFGVNGCGSLGSLEGYPSGLLLMRHSTSAKIVDIFVPGKRLRTHNCFQGSFRLLDKTLINSTLVWTERCGDDPANSVENRKFFNSVFFFLY